MKSHRSLRLQFVLIALLAISFADKAFAANVAKSIVLGIAKGDGEKFNAEFAKDSKLARWYQSQGITAILFDYRDLSSPEKLKRFNAILVVGRLLEISAMTPDVVATAKGIGKGMSQYVADGGGLLIMPQSVRYAHNQDEAYWNIAFTPFGAEILHEGVFDLQDQNDLNIKPFDTSPLMAQFFYTSNIAPHPLTTQVHGLWLPLHSFHAGAGTVAMKYAPEWQVIVSGEKTAASYLSDPETNAVVASVKTIGTYKTSPPIVVVRSFGKGRVASYSLDVIHAGENYGNPFWGSIVESAGDAKSGKKSDGMLLMAGLTKWVGESSENLAGFGTATEVAYQPIQFPASSSWDDHPISKLPDNWWKSPANGILGAHSSYSDGTGTVAQYVGAAKAAGLSFIVFTDPLERLTPEKLQSLKDDCARCSDKGFYACPGVEFTDGNGIRWALWSDRVVWPPSVYLEAGKQYSVWNDKKKVVDLYGAYQDVCGLSMSAVIDYKQLKSAGAFQQNMWWFYSVFPYAYDDGKMIADNTKELLFSLRDLRYVVPMPFTRITSPSEVAAAKQTALAGIGTAGSEKNVAAVKKLLNEPASGDYSYATVCNTFVTYGDYTPVILRQINGQMEKNWRYTRGGQRIEVEIDAHSDVGIKEVKLLDPSSEETLRRYLPAQGTKTFSQLVELVHDKQHWVVVEVTDDNGKTSYSNTVLLYSYKQGLFRCGDNLNILGPLGMYWHPDRNQALSQNKDFRNANLFSIQGWDRGGPDCPQPMTAPMEVVHFKDIGQYPVWPKGVLGTRMDVTLSSYNIQIIDMKMDDLMGYAVKNGPGPALSSISQKVGENEYFDRWDRMISPGDRIDHYVAWNYRRWAESVEKYDGDVMWHEGYVEFKRDEELAGDIPIQLGNIDTPLNIEKGWGTTFVAQDADKGSVHQELTDSSKKVSAVGRLAGGGYAAVVNNPIGYIGIMVPAGSELHYQCNIPGKLTYGIGTSGQLVHAGTVLKYAYAIANVVGDQGQDGEKLQTLSRAFDLDGKGAGYPLEMKVGTLKDASYFLTTQASGNETSFSAGPQKELGIDLPIKVEGCDDNGCAAVYSSLRPWFRYIPVVKDTAYFQEPIDDANQIWAGNVFLSDNKDLKITLVVDGQAVDSLPLLEVNNPTDQPIAAKLSSPAHTPRFGGMEANVKIDPGTSVFYRIDGKELKPTTAQ